MKFFVKTVLSISLGLFLSFYSANAATLGVKSIQVQSDTQIKVEFSENPNLRVGKQEGEIKILQDMKVMGQTSLQNPKVVSIKLPESLKTNTNYSLLNVLGADGSIDFSTPTSLSGFSTENPLLGSENIIEKIQVVSPNILQVVYSQDISAGTLEYKLLVESEVTQIEYQDPESSEILIDIKPPLQTEKEYILMFIDIRDIDGQIVEFDTGIYDFTVPALLMSSEESLQDIQAVEPSDTLEVIEVIGRENEDTMRDMIDLESAPDVSLKKNTLNEVAANVPETPDTGAETWVLILLTFIINSFYFFARRKKLLYT